MLFFWRLSRMRGNIYIAADIREKLGIPNSTTFWLFDMDGPKLLIRPNVKEGEYTKRVTKGRSSFPDTILRKYMDGAKTVRVPALVQVREGLIFADFRDAII